MGKDITNALLTTQQAAETLGVSRARVLTLIAEGKLPAVRFGKSWLIDRVDVERLAATPRPPGWKKGRPRKEK